MGFGYDLLVIGSGPAGQKAAVQGAKLGKRVCVIERRQMVGGVCVNTGTIPSKTLREAVIYLTGLSQQEMYGSSYRVSRTSRWTTSAAALDAVNKIAAVARLG